MREFKFRAWHNNHMTYFDGMWASEEYRSVCFVATDESLIEHDLSGAYSTNSPDRKLYKNFMEYVGLKDKNGKEIYEDDIILFKDDWTESHRRFIFRWHVTGFWLWDILQDDWSNSVSREEKHYEVIGNIYENPSMTDV